MQVTPDTLDQFVASTDALGGPGGPGVATLWQSFRYSPKVKVDTALDPDSPRYFDQMMALYEEISGTSLNQAVTEMTPLDVDALVSKTSPYHFASAPDRATHYLRLARALRQSGLPTGGRVIDMGCGWGLSSEFLASLGFEVVAVDISPLFADLVSRRARRLGLPITVKNSSFDDHVEPPGSVDGVLFYECLHHAVRLRPLVQKVASWLRPNGALVLAGEPIQGLYWPHWGFRLDPLSVYCIRKFGWWESGWSAEYLQRVIADSGLIPALQSDADPEIGYHLVARKSDVLDAAQLAAFAAAGDWWTETSYLVSNRSGTGSRLDLSVRRRTPLALTLHNFASSPLTLTVDAGGDRSTHALAPGKNVVAIAAARDGLDLPRRLLFECASWCPNDVLGNGDIRQLGLHLESIRIER